MAGNRRRAAPLYRVYRDLHRHFGPQHWWPGRTRLEIIVGAILTQNTAWSNVERAIRNLRKARALNLESLHRVPLETLAEWIRPAGYFRVKARRIRSFTTLACEQFGGDLRRLFALETAPLREILLAVNGIGPETADSILLYAAERPVFVVDAYTRRFLLRHRWIGARATYDEMAGLFTAQLSRDVALYNEYHALIVALGKNRCKARPRCEGCPLESLLPARTMRRR
ncbi:MAG: Endonuclease III [Verrucomicrobia bacterium ADurb.Bin345]|nr:MAG: Endonuclease III [Verrucomicrobia bacterium ADurb.Bin345]